MSLYLFETKIKSNMINKQLLNIIMLALGYALASNPYTNTLNPGLVRALTWFLAGLGKINK